VLDCAVRSVGRATQLWRIGSWAASPRRQNLIPEDEP
jgi:hypothetical protein